MNQSHKALTQRLSSLQNIPENQTCCECSACSPDWAFLMKSPLSEGPEDRIGAFICFTCSTAHKKLNESLGEVKSITVGSWTTADVRAMARGGNGVINQIFEKKLSLTTMKPSEASDVLERSLFLELKYGQRQFYCPTEASRLLKSTTEPSSSEEPSGHSSSRREALSSCRQRSMPLLGLSPQRTPSQSGRRGVRRHHSNDEWEALSPVSTGVYSQSMSTISTKSTLFGSGRSSRKIQIIKESPVRSLATSRLQNVSLDSFIEANSDPRKRNKELDLNTPPIMEAAANRRGSIPFREFHLDDDDNDTRPKMCVRVQSSKTLLDGFSQEGGSYRSTGNRSGRRTKSLDIDDFGSLENPPSMGTSHTLTLESGRVRRRGSMGSSHTLTLDSGRVHRRGSMGSSQPQQLSLESGPVRRRGSLGGRRISSVERLNRRTNSIDSQQGKLRATLSRRNLSLDSDDIMGSPLVRSSRSQRRNSLADSTPQRERPKYSRKISSPSLMDTSDRLVTPEASLREPWMEGKTPIMTGRRKSVGMDSVASRTGGMKNPMDRSDRSQSREPAIRAPRRNSLLGSQNGMNVSNHGAGPNVLRRPRSKRSFATQGSTKSILSKEEKLSDSEQSQHSRADSRGNRSIPSANLHLRQGLIAGDKRSTSSRGLESLRGSLGARKSTDSDLTSSRLESVHSSNIAIANRSSKTSSNDLGSKLHRIDKEGMVYDITSNEHKSPTSPLTTSTASKRIPRSLHVVLCAHDDENRTFVSTVTGTSSLDSHWSLHKERWKA